MKNKFSDLLQNLTPIIMGILNVTPDSFSDGGLFVKNDIAINYVKQMIADGADIIDIGGESTRPGAKEVSIEEELQRVIPVIKAIRQFSDVAISIDTSKPEVMREAIKAGANMINDVNALQAENAIETAVELNVPVCLMHMQGKPRTMQSNPEYTDVVEEVIAFLKNRISVCHNAGISSENIIVDPGFGFGKTLEHNLTLFKHLEEFTKLDCAVLVGVSRKSMIGAILDNAPADERLYGSVALATLAAWKNANILRVHDVKATADALKLCQAVKEA
ncbi:MAG: dihydropteroate synthase [Gammaproteobacteria bacterium]|nr:dihydropteroate synthase [Gammaproteobacteria bacterium]MDH5660932.1 dihydropteroate synthase [Gammaproteobacteria bacterium]